LPSNAIAASAERDRVTHFAHEFRERHDVTADRAKRGVRVFVNDDHEG
jgi:hypothetical protein